MGEKSIMSSAKNKGFVNNYVNCSNFKITNENEDYYKMTEGGMEEKDYRQMIISTPPSNAEKASKYGIMVNSTQNGITLFSCTPKEERGKERTKDENMKTTMFN